MKRVIRKLKSQGGETLVESIVSFALIVIALLGFTAMVTLGMRLNAQAFQTDTTANAVLAEGTAAQVTISSGEVSSAYEVQLLQNQDGSVSGYDALPAAGER